MTNVQKSKVKCSCGSTYLNLIEVWEGSTITWEQNKGLFDRDEGNLEYGNPYKVEARCLKCDKQWTIRGAMQITDVII